MKICYTVRISKERVLLANIDFDICSHEREALREDPAAFGRRLAAELQKIEDAPVQPAWPHEECPDRCTHDELSPHRITAVLAEDVTVPDHRRHRPR